MDHEARLLGSLSPLCEPLYDVLTNSRTSARSRLPDMVGDAEVSSVLTHVIRGLTLLELRTRDLGPWRLIPQNNAGIQLTDDQHCVRVLHQLSGGSVPPPGPNIVRRRYYSNPTLDLGIFPENHNLLALWRESREGAITVRIVRPVGQWSFGGRHKVDLDFVLPPLAADLDSLRYDTADEDIVVNLPGEEEESGGQHGVAG